ncbi:aldo/keto reductase [Amycolatopsis sp.]|jgi:aryl-alcohol dehydrogenase-like predicted oxidoreductase|uniref:aldo/keto reductase n=1 Tax=Amycolatopsis sp. TaxID=37632 RepID=UPI002DF9750A|nr:aldo/keto reductase [Amycolatopsis sp.]
MTDAPLWTKDKPPRQGLGLMRLRDADGGTPDADRDPVAVVHAALDAGITLLDTAELYGNEDLVGRTIAGRRHEVTLCTKFGVVWGAQSDDWSVHADPASVVASCEASLSRLNIETIDLYYLHHRSEDTPIEETITAMAELVDSGKIRAIGLSNVTAEDVRRAHAVHPILAVQEQWSLASRDVETTMLPTVVELGITLVAHSPLGHGILGGTSDPASPDVARTLADIATGDGVSAGQVALAWVHSQAERRNHPVVPLPGSTSVQHVLANVLASTIRLRDEDIVRLDEVSAATGPIPSR